MMHPGKNVGVGGVLGVVLSFIPVSPLLRPPFKETTLSLFALANSTCV